MRKNFTMTFVLLVILLVNISAATFDNLIDKAAQLYQEGKYLDSAELYEKAFESGEPTDVDYYDAACCWALAGNKEKALENLSKAIEAGWLDEQWMSYDSDLKLVQQDERFKNLITRILENKAKLIENLPEFHLEETIIDLPEPKFTSDYSIEQTLKERRSIRSYLDLPLSITEVSQILWAAYGVTYHQEGMPEFLRGGLKTAPSAGALYPLELYIAVSNVSGLAKGIYKYKADGHKLIQLSTIDVREELYNCAYNQNMVLDASVSLIYSAVYSRTTDKYGERGRERYVCMDLGHSAENVYLQVVSLDIGTCAIGAFNDLQLRLLINMTKKEEPLYIMPLGKIKK